jgi:drug/metabolite transporter (DMT)-like permease
MHMESARLLLKTRVFTTLVVLSSVLGNLSLGWGLRRVGTLVSVSPLVYIRALFDPWVALGVALLIVWLLSHMTLLSWADLSYVLPVTSVGYVLTALAGRLWLNEQITLTRWAGIVLITIGVSMVGRTAVRSNVKARAAGASQ